MKNNIKSMFYYILIFFSITIFLPSSSYGGYGIVIDEESVNISPAIRVLFFNLDSQRAEDVNYYTKNDFTGIYALKENEKIPLKYFILKENADPIVIVEPSFNLDDYVVMSKFPLYKLDEQTLHSSLSNLEEVITEIPQNGLIDLGKFKYFIKNKPLLNIQELQEIFIKIDIANKDKKIKNVFPTFRLTNMKSSSLNKKSSFLDTLFEMEAKWLKDHKEALGEQVFLLSFLNYGFQDGNIYNGKLKGIPGFDFICTSGKDPEKDELFLIESKWNPDTGESSVLLDKYITYKNIINRIGAMKTEKLNKDVINIMPLVESFLTTPNARIYRVSYRVFDNKNKSKTGVVRPCIELIDEEEKIKIATQCGYHMKKPNLTINFLSKPITQSIISNEISLNIETTESLSEFMNFLRVQPNTNLTPILWEFLKQKYLNEYNLFLNSK